MKRYRLIDGALAAAPKPTRQPGRS